MKTKAELISRALGFLNVIQAGQDPSAEDYALVEGHVSGKVAELARRKILYVNDVDSIEDELFLPLARLVANSAGPEFGQPYDPNVDAREEQRIKDINRGPSVYETLRTEYI